MNRAAGARCAFYHIKQTVALHSGVKIRHSELGDIAKSELTISFGDVDGGSLERRRRASVAFRDFENLHRLILVCGPM